MPQIHPLLKSRRYTANRVRLSNAAKTAKSLPDRGGFQALWIQLSAFHFVALEATRADVSGFNLSVFYDFHFLYVRFESSPRLAVAVADVIAGVLPLIADAAHSRHIHTSTVIIWQKIERGKSAPLKTSIDTIPKSIKKSNRFCMSFRIFSSKLKKQWGKVNFLLQNKRK